MVLTPSTMLPLGTAAPDFDLLDTVSGERRSLADFTDEQALVMMFICNHCPYVKHLAEGLAALGRDYEAQRVALVAISANDPIAHPEDAPERLAQEARERGYRFPYLFDETQAVAQAYTAACTPDFFLFDRDRKLVYRGQFDPSRPESGIPVSGEDLRRAIDCVLAGRAPSADQKPSLGCNIKWREDNAPDYFRA